ncbi:MAG: hypothetical protein AAGC63_01600 [Propionicimonas sp.]|nr:hypothetical protein [Propionicimonas sp.]
MVLASHTNRQFGPTLAVRHASATADSLVVLSVQPDPRCPLAMLLVQSGQVA